ncbi:MAG: hypothetical protein APG08_01295 [Candidatus Methanofastidiosum methylothiophilum]|jgi:hypothetical protein|uniref:Uncharacterized protein n=1 Tax=Candidatus Methanofastidiosum methylothiophilum TaxID=1705564 RepID=A0A150JHH7_9EURY|nr:MAG: hypothetical protein AN188_01295 [Candidatus Methanofastidiosum methylthiophilus]KYC55931.1 MAG: hypothetical protein APG08_01295 [Candidatus Methanofastidiosum methylthiophilus]KYC56699.1 MAG: hypothetical protein APG09_01307 [Candidatus Methanofastidiosum methylthiophilus]
MLVVVNCGIGNIELIVNTIKRVEKGPFYHHNKK